MRLKFVIADDSKLSELSHDEDIDQNNEVELIAESDQNSYEVESVSYEIKDDILLSAISAAIKHVYQ